MKKRLVFLLFLILVLNQAIFGFDPASVTPTKEVVMEGLLYPWSIAFISEDEALVSEKDGHLLRVNLKSGEKTELKGFPPDVGGAVKVDVSKARPGTYPRDADGKTLRYNVGLFEILLDPNFKSNSFIYLSYAAKNDRGLLATKVIRARLKDDSLSEIKTLFVATPFEHGLFHFGGGMTFGRDGKLYFTVGDRQFSESLQPSMPFAQNVRDRRGKVYRINSDGSIPGDNPDFGESAVEGLFAIGIRAAQGLTLNPRSGNIWFSEHGTLQGDEINQLIKGANFGWPLKTSGRYRDSAYKPPVLADSILTDPKWYWRQTVAPTGLVFYNGKEFPEWQGDLFVSGLSRGSFWRVRLENETIKSLEELFVDSRVRSRKVAVSPQGQLYILTDEKNGKIIKIMRKTSAGV